MTCYICLGHKCKLVSPPPPENHCAKQSVSVLGLGIFLWELLCSQKYFSPKQLPPISHNDLKKTKQNKTKTKNKVINV